MQVRILKTFAAPGHSYVPGQIVDLETALAKALVKASAAEPCKSQPRVEPEEPLVSGSSGPSVGSSDHPLPHRRSTGAPSVGNGERAGDAHSGPSPDADPDDAADGESENGTDANGVEPSDGPGDSGAISTGADQSPPADDADAPSSGRKRPPLIPPRKPKG
jgi:hypothetical protein